MQYSVPQFIDVEDKIIGPLTLKQFLILLGGGLVSFFYWGIFDAGLIFFLLTLPTMGLFAFLAFGKFNGRPMLANLPFFLKFYLTPRERIFQRTTEVITLPKKVTKPLPPAAAKLPTEERVSRLKRLAYLLDQKTAEEERLIHSGKLDKQWLNQI